MLLNSINKALTSNRLWVVISVFSMLLLLSPLLFNGGEFYVPIFDNLDSTVVWYKILAQSGMIFADNSAIIPNMMSGLPRSSYYGEFDVVLWLYYFFEPKTAFIINEISIHVVAFFSMYIFLKKYIIKEKHYYKNIPVFAGALYFSLLPYWQGAGLTIAIMPLVTYSLLNIKNRIDSKWDWILLILLPLYASFVFFYMFYIVYAGIYLVWIAIKNRKLNSRLFFALLIMGVLFLLTEYRLLYAMFIDSGFASHRSEFNIFYNNTFLEIYRDAQNFFIAGHPHHLLGLQAIYVLPIIIIAMMLSLSNKRFTAQESMVIWLLILLSFIVNVWDIVLRQLYSLPILVSFFLYIALFSKKNRITGVLLLFQIGVIFLAVHQFYSGFASLAEIFPILKTLNLSRIAFVQSTINTILLVYAIVLLSKKLLFSNIFITLFLLLQLHLSLEESFYSNKEKEQYASFEQYYAPTLFDKLKTLLKKPLDTIRIVSYGLEPAVTLYNGFYTIDGYSVNYPLEYKRKFREVISKYLDSKNNLAAKEARKVYDEWGGKAYILSTTVTLQYYTKNILVQNPQFSTQALCKLHTDYLISSHKIDTQKIKNLSYIDTLKGEKNSWDIYIYKIECKKEQ